MTRKKLAFFGEEALKRATLRYYCEDSVILRSLSSTDSLLFTFPFCCLSCKKQIEK